MSNEEKRNTSQKKQLIIMAVVLALCAVLVTWTVLLLKDRFDRNQTNEQVSPFDLAEVSDNSETVTTAPVTGGGMWEDVLAGVTTVTSVKTRVTLPTTESAPPATRKLVTQSAVFIKVTTAKTAVTTKKNSAAAAAGTTKKAGGAGSATTASAGSRTTATTAKPQTTAHSTMPPATTHPQTATHPQTTPAPATAAPPSSAQVIYNQLLAIYLGAGTQNGKAYYYEPTAAGQPTVVIGNADSGYDSVFRASDCVKRISLGGTGDSNENPWQTGADFTFRKNNGSNYAFYESEGSNNRIVGAFNPDTGDNVWMRLHYTEENGTVKAEYHLYRKNASGVQNELSAGTGDADRVYALPADIAQIAVAAGFPSGDISSLPEVSANSQDDLSALKNRAGTYNDSFTLQPGALYGAIGANADNVYLRAGMSLASNIIASLPAGTFVCVDSGFDPDNPGVWCPVSVFVNGTWNSGYVSAVYVLTWKSE